MEDQEISKEALQERERCADIIQWHRENGESDHRQMIHWIKSGDNPREEEA